MNRSWGIQTRVWQFSFLDLLCLTAFLCALHFLLWLSPTAHPFSISHLLIPVASCLWHDWNKQFAILLQEKIVLTHVCLIYPRAIVETMDNQLTRAAILGFLPCVQRWSFESCQNIAWVFPPENHSCYLINQVLEWLSWWHLLYNRLLFANLHIAGMSKCWKWLVHTWGRSYPLFFFKIVGILMFRRK